LAAAALERGGIHRDAAIIYLKLVHDSHAAARCYEAGGMGDEALAIYRDRGDHVLAGDLLRKIGPEEEAIEEYELAAARLAASSGGYYQAGELMLTKARRAHLAQRYYRRGWDARPTDSPVPCAIRLAQLNAQSESAVELTNLIVEAEEYF